MKLQGWKEKNSLGKGFRTIIFPKFGVQGSVMQKTHAGSRAAPKVRHRLLSREVYRTIVLLYYYATVTLCSCVIAQSH